MSVELECTKVLIYRREQKLDFAANLIEVARRDGCLLGSSSWDKAMSV